MSRVLLNYLSERVHPALFVPILAMLWWSAFWAAGATSVTSRHALSFLLMVLLVLQFRLWDDLEDVERDRLAHPERVLSRSPVRGFRRLLVALSGANLAGTAALSSTAFMGVALLDTCFLVAYRVVRPRVSDVTWRFPILLAKYPAFVVLVATTMGARAGGRLTIAALVVMTGACVYEAVHQQRTAGGLS